MCAELLAMVDCRSLWEWDILKEASDFNYYKKSSQKEPNLNHQGQNGPLDTYRNGLKSE